MTVIFACKLLNLVLLEESSFLVTCFTVVGAFANAGNRLIVFILTASYQKEMTEYTKGEVKKNVREIKIALM